MAERSDGQYNIVFGVNGTRGDFQPFLSLALKLIQRGHKVLMFSSVNHCKVAELFNVDAMIVGGDVSEGLQDENAKRAMERGDFALIVAPREEEQQEEEEKGPDLIEGETLERHLEKATEAYIAFKPDLYVTNGLGHIYFYDAVPNLPKIDIALQQQGGPPSNSFQHIFWARELPEPNTPLICTHIWFLQAQARGMHQTRQYYWWMKTAGQEIEEGLLEKIPGPERVFFEAIEYEKHPWPKIMAYSPSVFPPPEDWPKEGLEIVGNLKLTKEEQDNQAKSGNSFFTNGSDHSICEQFLNSGPAPVYIGWGSMSVYTSQHMTALAVEALKKSGQRGVIVSGWAKLKQSDLEGLPNEEELLEYAKENIIFIKTAPHEWLFPQCCCCVHHGGVGTLQASLSAGAPTIITPVFADQEDNAAALTRGGYGVGTSRLGVLKSDELGAAIKQVCSDKAIMERSQALRDRMAKEDGIGRSVEIIEKFLREKVITGKYQEECDALEKEHVAIREKQVQLSADVIFARWNGTLNKRFSAWKDYQQRTFAFTASCSGLIEKNRLYWVKASSCLVREAESIKSAETGRFKQFCFLEEVDRKKDGARLRVKKLKGWGPEEGWVSPTANGKDILEKVENMESVSMIQAEMFNKIFEDLAPPKKT